VDSEGGRVEQKIGRFFDRLESLALPGDCIAKGLVLNRVKSRMRTTGLAVPTNDRLGIRVKECDLYISGTILGPSQLGKEFDATFT
jgi:hypothetical protein